MRKYLFPALCALALGVTALGAPSAAAMPNEHRGQRMEAVAGHQMDRLFQELNLTDAQKEQIKAIRQRTMESAKPIRENLRTKHQELFTLIKKADTTKDQAIAKQREIHTLSNQLADSRINAWFEARALLTPEQLKKLETVQPPKGMRRHMGK